MVPSLILAFFNGLLERRTGPPKLEPMFAPRRAKAAASEMAKRLGNLEMKEPGSYDLAELYERILAAWRRDRSLYGVSARDLRRLPFVVFYSPTDGNPSRGQDSTNYWLGAQTGIVREYERWLFNGLRAGSVRELLKQFVAAYPVDLPTFEDLRQLLRRSMEVKGISSPPPSLEKWRQRCFDFRLLQEDGNLSFVEDLVSASDPVGDILSQSGFDTGLARCRFLESGLRGFLPTVSTMLVNDSIEDKHLGRLLTLLECEGKLRFDEQPIRVEIASAFLSPYIDRSPPADAREQLQSFFLDHFGDPRLPSGRHRWHGVGEDLRHVVSRWLVKEALDGFIRLVKETAFDQHWRYRQRFWMACFSGGLIQDAWFVLGSRARRLLMRLEEHRPGATGRLRGASPEQSVLLLRMSGVTVAEWSNSGSCRMWLDGNEDAPKLYQGRVYSGTELRHGSDCSIQHRGSEYGRWQDQVARWLRENTGATISRGEYMPAEPSWPARRPHGRRNHI